jgi:hypothetical protein
LRTEDRGGQKKGLDILKVRGLREMYRSSEVLKTLTADEEIERSKDVGLKWPKALKEDLRSGRPGLDDSRTGRHERGQATRRTRGQENPETRI